MTVCCRSTTIVETLVLGADIVCTVTFKALATADASAPDWVAAFTASWRDASVRLLAVDEELVLPVDDVDELLVEVGSVILIETTSDPAEVPSVM